MSRKYREVTTDNAWSRTAYSTAATLATIVVVTVLLALLGAMFFSSATWGKWKIDGVTANWAQAFSSVAAILIGAGAIVWQVKRQGQERDVERKAAEARVLHTLQQELFGCRLALERLYSEPWGSDEKRVREIERGVARLRELRISDIADWQTHLAVRKLAETLDVSQLSNHTYLERLRVVMVEAERRFEGALQERGFELLPLEGEFDEVFTSRRFKTKAGDTGTAADIGPALPKEIEPPTN